jgi:hypothetical protein
MEGKSCKSQAYTVEDEVASQFRTSTTRLPSTDLQKSAAHCRFLQSVAESVGG